VKPAFKEPRPYLLGWIGVGMLLLALLMVVLFFGCLDAGAASLQTSRGGNDGQLRREPALGHYLGAVLVQLVPHGHGRLRGGLKWQPVTEVEW
jgi:hypothetical protein